MNIFVVELAKSELEDTSTSDEIRIEDNIGESIHIHFPGARLEMTVDDFEKLSRELRNSIEVIENGNS
jgi:Cu2+-containing amine oxidase